MLLDGTQGQMMRRKHIDYYCLSVPLCASLSLPVCV
jgi:hypothetical protein